MSSQAAGYHGPNPVQPELERRHDAEITAAAPQSPEQVSVFFLAGAQYFPIPGHHLGRQKIIERHSKFRHQPAKSTAKRQPCNTRGGNDAASRGQSMELGFAIEFRPSDTALGTRLARFYIHMDALHR